LRRVVASSGIMVALMASLARSIRWSILKRRSWKTTSTASEECGWDSLRVCWTDHAPSSSLGS
jgi:hypothetical protein